MQFVAIVHIAEYIVITENNGVERMHLLKLVAANQFKIGKVSGKKVKRGNSRPTTTPIFLENNAEENPVPVVQSKVSQFQYFKSELILNGTLQWRERSASKNTAIMNNMSSTTGSFKVLSFGFD